MKIVEDEIHNQTQRMPKHGAAGGVDVVVVSADTEVRRGNVQRSLLVTLRGEHWRYDRGQSFVRW